MREQLISPEWIEKALEYWSELNNILDDSGEKFEEDLIPEIWSGVPFQNWECRYCQYYSICPSELAK
jgi:predicted RecB family nuclease